jgi:CheY-like chemotaxis protein
MDRCLRVLLVDDCPDSRATLRILLDLWGHEVREAGDADAALALAATFRPDAVLLDVGLPGPDGGEAARRLRSLPGLGGALVVALLGPGASPDAAACRAAGFDHHLLKPFDPVDLKRLLASPANGAAPPA